MWVTGTSHLVRRPPALPSKKIAFSGTPLAERDKPVIGKGAVIPRAFRDLSDFRSSVS